MGDVTWLAPGSADGLRPCDSIIGVTSTLFCHLVTSRTSVRRPQDRAPVSDRGLVVAADGRRMISTVAGITGVAAGVILRFAVPVTVTYGLNAHVVSVIVMLAGIFGLLLSLLVWGPLDRRRNTRTRLRGARRSRDRESTPRESGHRAEPRVLWQHVAVGF